MGKGHVHRKMKTEYFFVKVSAIRRHTTTNTKTKKDTNVFRYFLWLES